MSSHKFDKTYYENGQRTGVSLYKDFRWMPNVSIPIANTVKEVLGCDRILDYGCAKGFIVYALRLLNVEAYGFDISDYALSNCKKEVKGYLYNSLDKIPSVDGILAKDVLEHVEYEDIASVLSWIAVKCKKALVIVPLADDNEYRISEYVFDKTHIIKENEEGWIRLFNTSGLVVDKFYHNIPTIKDGWYEHNCYGNGFFILKGIGGKV